MPQLLAYGAPGTSFANPIPLGDQTLWSPGMSTDGVFSGVSSAELVPRGDIITTSSLDMQGDGRARTVRSSSSSPILTVSRPGGRAWPDEDDRRPAGDADADDHRHGLPGHALGLHADLRPLHSRRHHLRPFRSPSRRANGCGPRARLGGWPIRRRSRSQLGTFVITNYVNGYFWGKGIGPDGDVTYTLLGLDHA